MQSIKDEAAARNAAQTAAYRARRREQGIPMSGAAQRARAAEQGKRWSDGDPETTRARKARYRQRRRKQIASGERAKPPIARKPWLFVDTEGATDHKGVYGDLGRQYTMLAVAATDGFEATLYRGRPLRTHELLWWLLGLPPTHKLGGYFFGYDIAQIVADLPEEDLRRLYGAGGEEPGVVRYRRWLVSLFQSQLTVCTPTVMPDALPDAIERVRGRRRVIWDVGRFYAAKLTTAIEHWQVSSPDEAKFVAEMKDSRSDFTLASYMNARELKRINDYALTECRLAARMQTKFDEVCEQQGYPLHRWYGAGSVAKAMLTAHGLKDHLASRKPLPRRHNLDADMVQALPHAYFGGRFEIRAPGEYQPVYEYDIRSAYPAAYRILPCLMHGTYRPARDLNEIVDVDLYAVRWKIPSTHTFGPFPERLRSGAILYPAQGSGIVWGVELAAARRLWPIYIQVERRWRYQQTCSCQPFGWIDDVYRKRVQLGKDTAGIPLKLGMNAIYGTLASTLGASYEHGQLSGWGEPVWSSLITAWTRAMLLDALGTAGGPRNSNVIMFATDAIYATEPIEGLDLRDRLGSWEAHSYPRGGLLIQPGIYHLRGQRRIQRLKGRGLEYRTIQEHIARFYIAYRRHGANAQVLLPLPERYTSLRLALHRGDLSTAWRWRHSMREIKFDPSTKREYRGGKWMPHMNPGEDGGYPHGGFAALLIGDGIEAPPSRPQAAIELDWNEQDQPTGPAAL